MSYADTVLTVKAAIDAKGRLITLQKLSTAASDPTKPWNGPAQPATPSLTEDVKALFLPSFGKRGFGLTMASPELLARVDQVCMIAPPTNNPLEFNLILDGGTQWKIDWVNELRPGDTALLYSIGVKR